MHMTLSCMIDVLCTFVHLMPRPRRGAICIDIDQGESIHVKLQSFERLWCVREFTCMCVCECWRVRFNKALTAR